MIIDELADALVEHPDGVLDLGVLLGVLHDLAGEDLAGIHEVLREVPDPVPGVTRAEFAVRVRLTALGVRR
jgi:hypothetical protein